jgi:hypothetical protein
MWNEDATRSLHRVVTRDTAYSIWDIVRSGDLTMEQAMHLLFPEESKKIYDRSANYWGSNKFFEDK